VLNEASLHMVSRLKTRARRPMCSLGNRDTRVVTKTTEDQRREARFRCDSRCHRGSIAGGGGRLRFARYDAFGGRYLSTVLCRTMSLSPLKTMKRLATTRPG
jgi:hypothetical protein